MRTAPPRRTWIASSLALCALAWGRHGHAESGNGQEGETRWAPAEHDPERRAPRAAEDATAPSDDEPVRTGPSTLRTRLDVTRPYVDGAPVPDGYRLERSWQSELVVPSTFVLATSYFLSFTVAAASDFRGPNRFLVIPLGGPFLTAATSPSGACRLFCFSGLSTDDAVVRTALVADGLAQLVSALFLAARVGAPEFVLVKEARSGVHFVPVHVAGGYGFGVRGLY